MSFKFVRQSIDEDSIEDVLALADMGLSYKTIAREVWGDGHIETLVKRVANILNSYGIRVRDYREGLNKHGKSVIAAIRRDANVLQAIRSAAKEVTASIRKTG